MLDDAPTRRARPATGSHAGTARSGRVGEIPSSGHSTAGIGRHEGHLLSAAWVSSAPQGSFRRVCVVNRSGAPLVHAVAIAGAHRECRRGVLAEGARWEFNVPAEAPTLAAWGHAGGDAPRWRGAQWSLSDAGAREPVVVVQHAGTIRKLNVDVMGRGGRRVADVRHAGEVDEVNIVERAPDHPSFDALPCLDEVDVEGIPEWLMAGRATRWLLFAGDELTLGRSSRVTWTVFTRAEDGERALAADRFGQPRAIARAEWDEKGIHLPVSRCHATMRWQGKVLELCDGRPDRPSARGVFNQRGLRLDAGWRTLRAPSQLWLGPPHDPYSLLLDCARFDLPGRGACVALRCANQDHGEIVLWQRRPAAWFDFEAAAGVLAPTWLKQAHGLRIERRPPGWTVSTAGLPLPLSLHSGASVEAGAVRVSAPQVSTDRAILETATG